MNTYREKLAAENALRDRLTQQAAEAGGFLNLTPHAITLVLNSGEHRTIQPSGTVARVQTFETSGQMAWLSDGTGYETIGTVYRRTGAAEGLPPEGTPCLVSALVLATVPDRAGVFAPDTGPTAIREDGLVVAVTRLVRA